MNVRGISVLTRKILVTRRFGTDAWAQFFRDVASSHRCFRSLVSADTLVPLPAFLAFHDELMRRFFKDDEVSYSKLGRESSRWALTEGPLQALLKGESFESVVGSLPKFHRLYFEDANTWSEAALSGASVEFKVFELPQWHPYLEHFITGYIAEVLEMYCANPIRTVRLRGGAGKEYHYLFHGAPTAHDDELTHSAGRGKKLPVVEAGRHLSNREIEVLLLVARGRTNEEIGGDLGISKKTAQHHVAHAYRKIGVSGRVGAAVWLAERGLLGSDAMATTSI